jgi:hypothetical protein
MNKDGGVTWNTDAESGKWGSTGLQLSSVLNELNESIKSESFLNFISEITGFKNLIVTKNINGVGFSFFHGMQPGAFLAPHTDHTRDLNKGAYHVANIIFYMSKEWDSNWGGGTTLFKPNINLATNVEFKPNRALIFMHSPISIHGVQKISNNADSRRFSIYYDFYTHDKQPFGHLNLKNTFSLHDSPHRFYLNKFYEYLYPRNSRYLKSHFSHLKNLLKFKITGKI